MTPSGWGWEAEKGIVDSWKEDTGQTGVHEHEYGPEK
jgi:hypothetical protein